METELPQIAKNREFFFSIFLRYIEKQRWKIVFHWDIKQSNVIPLTSEPWARDPVKIISAFKLYVASMVKWTWVAADVHVWYLSTDLSWEIKHHV